MVFTSYDELRDTVQKRRQQTLTLEIEVDPPFSQEYADAQAALQQAEGMKMLTGGGFLGDNLGDLKQRVADTKPEAASIYLQFKKLDLNEWKKLITTPGLDAFGQYERALPQTFLGLYGEDPVKPDGAGDEWVAPEPLTADPRTVASGEMSVLEGGQLHAIVQSFMAWQNSGGEVNIRPTKSGRD